MREKLFSYDNTYKKTKNEKIGRTNLPSLNSIVNCKLVCFNPYPLAKKRITENKNIKTPDFTIEIQISESSYSHVFRFPSNM